GSGFASLLARQIARPRVALGVCQFLLAAAVAWTAYTLAHSLPYWPINPLIAKDPWFNFEVDLARCLWAVLPAACLWGASFPLALAAAAPQHKDSGRMVGAVYAANTVGAIVGAVAFSIIVIPAVGTLWAQRLLIAAAAVAAMLILLTRLRGGIPAAGRRLRLAAVMGAIVAVPVVAAALAYGAPPVP